MHGGSVAGLRSVEDRGDAVRRGGCASMELGGNRGSRWVVGRKVPEGVRMLWKGIRRDVVHGAERVCG